jgi:hypothetical protein
MSVVHVSYDIINLVIYLEEVGVLLAHSCMNRTSICTEFKLLVFIVFRL